MQQPTHPAAVTFVIDGDRITAAEEAVAVGDHASRLLPCPRPNLVVKHTLLGTPHSPVPVYFVDGCGQRLLYATTPTENELVVMSRFPRAPTQP